MTVVYAQLHEATVQEAFDRYCQARVDIAGRVLGFDPGAITAGAEWLKHKRAGRTVGEQVFGGRARELGTGWPNV